LQLTELTIYLGHSHQTYVHNTVFAAGLQNPWT